GLDEELIEKVMREHGKVVNSLKDEKSTIEQELESEKTKAVGLSEQIEERNEQLEKIKNENKNVEGLQETINQLKQSNSQKEEELKNQVSDTKRKYEIKLGLQKRKQEMKNLYWLILMKKRLHLMKKVIWSDFGNR